MAKKGSENEKYPNKTNARDSKQPEADEEISSFISSIFYVSRFQSSFNHFRLN